MNRGGEPAKIALGLLKLTVPTLKPRTRQGYAELLRGPLAKLRSVPVGAMTASTIRAWHASLGDATPTRRAHAYGLLHAILATAVTDGLLTTNPANERGAMSARTKREPVILSPTEVAKLAVSIRPELKALVLISAWCGLRYGEVIELRRKDIGEGCAVINVARGATHRAGRCYVDSPKSGRTRKVNVPKALREDIAEHLATVPSDPEAQLFPAPRGRCHYAEDLFRADFGDALKAIGREGVRVHDLRHFAGSQAARVGTLRETMDRLGHSTPSTSLRYQHSVSGRDAEVAEALSALIGLTADEVAAEQE